MSDYGKPKTLKPKICVYGHQTSYFVRTMTVEKKSWRFRESWGGHGEGRTTLAPASIVGLLLRTVTLFVELMVCGLWIESPISLATTTGEVYSMMFMCQFKIFHIILSGQLIVLYGKFRSAISKKNSMAGLLRCSTSKKTYSLCSIFLMIKRSTKLHPTLIFNTLLIHKYWAKEHSRYELHK